MPPMALLGTVIGALALIGILLVAIFGPRFVRKAESEAHAYDSEARPWDVPPPKKKRSLLRRS
jgi:hypothetical protein